MNDNRTADVSVVMATYNGARFIREQLDSIARQSLQPRELIVSDDRSTDETLRIVASIAETVPFPVRIVVNETRLGYADNFLSAARLATGRYVAFSDQDDIWYPQKIEQCVAALEQDRAVLCVHASDFIDEGSRVTGRYAQGIRRRTVHAPRTLPPWGVFAGFSCVCSRELLKVLDPSARGTSFYGDGGCLPHDAYLYFLAHSLGRVTVLPQPLAGYRQHGSNASGHRPRSWLQRWSVSAGQAASPRLMRERVADFRAAQLATVAETAAQPAFREEARRSMPYWTAVASHERARLRLYAADTRWQRLRLFLAVAVRGAYARPRHAGLGGGLAIKDLIVGALRWRRLKV
jgi:glycosyltransferase involved in cell wall biosynthesis